MTDRKSQIDDYVREVASHLKLRGRARRQALDDLRDALREAAEAVDDAIKAAGRAQDYAASLDDQFGTRDGRFQTILGAPNSLGRGIGRRMAGTFNPLDERLLVPRVFGIGWAVNMGAVAVKLGWLRPDDLDDEVLAEAADHLMGPAQLAAGAQIGLAAASAVLFWNRRNLVRAETGQSQTANSVFSVATPMVCAAILTASNDRKLPAETRVTMPALAAALATIATGASLQSAVRPKGQLIVLGASLAALVDLLLLSYLPVRSALKRGWRADLDWRNHV